MVENHKSQSYASILIYQIMMDKSWLQVGDQAQEEAKIAISFEKAKSTFFLVKKKLILLSWFENKFP